MVKSKHIILLIVNKGEPMISVYDFQDYRVFLNAWIDSQAKTRGLKGRLAEAMGISSTMLSLIFKGDKNLSLEQAAEARSFWDSMSARQSFSFC